VSSLVDWGLATRVAAMAAGEGGQAMSGGADLGSVNARSRAAVLAYTRLSPVEPVPEPEWISRRDWAQLNLDSMRELIEPLEARVGDALPPGRYGASLAAISGKVLALQLGGLIGLASRRVLGQYEFPLLGGGRAPRLVFVGQNIGVAATEIGGDPADVLEWVALHEVTHAVHLSSQPWLRGHLGGLARTLLEETPLAISSADLLAAARRFASTDPRRMLAELRETDPVMLLAPAQSHETIAAVQSTMALVEGYAEHVMDAAASGLGSRVEDLRAGLERRREDRGALARVLAWLLGFEMKLRQYRDGKRFADGVVASAGIAGLNRAWEGPGELPTLAELHDSARWIERVAAAHPA